MKSIGDIFDLSLHLGLSEAEAAKRLAEEGPNELCQSETRSPFSIALSVTREPMFLMLVACGSLYLVLGEPKEAAMLLGFVFVIMGITIYQERKTERALEALRDLSSPRALVVREGARRRIPGRETVRGDLVLIGEGDRVPADGRVLASMNLAVDESMLTGESVSVRKKLWEDEEPGQPGGDDLPWVFGGTLVIRGVGLVEVTAVGAATEMGRIGAALARVKEEPTQLSRETGRIVRCFGLIGAGLCAVVVLVFGLIRGDWLGGVLAGITLAMSILPEEFPVILTIFMALGAWRLSKRNTLTRRPQAVETLGAVTVLCVDKTGTLTQNRMTVARLWALGQDLDVADSPAALPESFHPLMEYGILSSQRDPSDPMEQAIRTLGLDKLGASEHLHDTWRLVREYPLSPKLLALSQVWESPDGHEFVVAAKGSPEAVAELCHLEAAASEELSRRVELISGAGLRCLGVARATFSKPDLPPEQHDFSFEFLGVIALSDPVRPLVPEAVRECHRAGVRTVMITGDYQGTAMSVARQIGLDNPEVFITGPELAAMAEDDLRERIRTVNIFARVVPEQKLRIVEAFKANGEVVAMTGDGVNDAPALKAAHIGIAMGGRGTDVAREASALVLLDDDYATIVQAVRLGRRIYDNLRKAMAYTVAVHVPIAGMSLVPIFSSDWPLVLMPMHIVFLELIIDPSCSIVFEAETEEPGIMGRPPRDTRQPLLNWRVAGLAVLQGLAALACVLAVFLYAMGTGRGPDAARTMAFATMVAGNLGLILVNRSWTNTLWSLRGKPNKALVWVLCGGLCALGLTLYVPLFRDLFHFQSLPLHELAACLAVGAFSVGWFEVMKALQKK